MTDGLKQKLMNKAVHDVIKVLEDESAKAGKAKSDAHLERVAKEKAERQAAKWAEKQGIGKYQ